MHELSLVRTIAARVARDAIVQGLSRVNVVRLEVGVLSSALPEALQFAWQSLFSPAFGCKGSIAGPDGAAGPGGPGGPDGADLVADRETAILSGSRLETEIMPAVTLCPVCGDRWEQQGSNDEALWFPELGACRRCGSGPLQLQAGLDLVIRSYAGE